MSATKPNLETLATTARQLANDLFGNDQAECSQPADKPSCIQLEEDRPLTREERAKGWERRPFCGYDHRRMCNACAVYWWAEMAAQVLHEMHCWQVRINAEKQRNEAAAQSAK